MTDINQAILAAFVSVRGERPKEPVINAPEIVHSSWRYVVRDWDTDLADFRKMLKALEQEGYRVVPIEQTQEMFEAWLNAQPDDTGDMEETAAFLWKAQVAASPEIDHE